MDELLRTEFTSRGAALLASRGADCVAVPEITSPLVKVSSGEQWNCGDIPSRVSYVMRRAVLKEFNFPRGKRWKFCLVDYD